MGKNYNYVYYPPYTAEAASEKINNSHCYFALVKLMSAKIAKEKANNKCSPFISRSVHIRHSGSIKICVTVTITVKISIIIGVVVRIIDIVCVGTCAVTRTIT